MVSTADRERDEAPPESGSRRRLLAPVVVPSAPVANGAEPDVLAEVAEEVCVEVWELVRALAPLQGAWLTLGIGQLGSALMTMARWQTEGEVSDQSGRQALRRRWPELVPGHAAMDRLVGLMVDRICR